MFVENVYNGEPVTLTLSSTTSTPRPDSLSAHLFGCHNHAQNIELAAIAALALYLPARWATRVAPTMTLRDE